LERIVESLNLKMTTRDLRHTDPKVQLQAFCSQWLPLARSVLGKFVIHFLLLSFVMVFIFTSMFVHWTYCLAAKSRV